jgi:hypothetical protein
MSELAKDGSLAEVDSVPKHQSKFSFFKPLGKDVRNEADIMGKLKEYYQERPFAVTMSSVVIVGSLLGLLYVARKR